MKKKDLLISILMIAGSMFYLLYSVSFSLPEFGLTVKLMFGQELSLEEMKSTSIYKAYNQIGNIKSEEEIDRILNKKSRGSNEQFRSWGYPYGILSVVYRLEEKPKVYIASVNFEKPFTKQLTQDELLSLFESSSLDEIVAVLGETAIMGRTYEEDGTLAGFSYEWAIKTKLTEEFVAGVEDKHGDYVDFPLFFEHPVDILKLPKKCRFRVLMAPDNSIKRMDVDRYNR